MKYDIINSFSVDEGTLSEGIELARISGIKHIAFIMDGNGRWATARGLVREAGHKVGMEAFERTVEYCADIGVQYVTVYAFSTENWKRPKREVDAILLILRTYLKRAMKLIHQKKVHFVVIGDTSVFDEKTVALINELDRESSCYDRVLNIALNYGGRDELAHAANLAIEAKLAAKEEPILTASDIGANLYTSPCPDPDMIVRTGGDMRLSNFLLWQSSYSELYFTGTLWPDYGASDVNEAIRNFATRKRRFGGVESVIGGQK